MSGQEIQKQFFKAEQDIILPKERLALAFDAGENFILPLHAEGRRGFENNNIFSQRDSTMHKGIGETSLLLASDDGMIDGAHDHSSRAPDDPLYWTKRFFAFIATGMAGFWGLAHTEVLKNLAVGTFNVFNHGASLAVENLARPLYEVTGPYMYLPTVGMFLLVLSILYRMAGNMSGNHQSD
jgi:hypothetical protein